MAFELGRRKHLDNELTKIVRRQLRETIRSLSEANASEDVIHEARKSVKKVRAVAASSCGMAPSRASPSRM